MIFQFSTPRMELWRIDGPFANELHSHDEDFQITVPMYGTCRFTLENRSYALADGGGLVQHPRERHVFEIGDQAGVFIFKVRQEGLQAFARRDSLELDLKQQFDRGRLAGQFRRWMDPLLLHGQQDRLAQEELETQVMSYLCDTLSGNHRAGFREETACRFEAAGADAHMARVLDYIHAHYTEPLSVEALANVAMQSRFHFIRAFKAAFGSTPYQYVLRLRLDDAKRWLSGSDRSVTEIAASLGFSSASALNRVFRHGVGVTPEQYRRDRVL